MKHYLYIGIAAAWALSLVVVGIWQNSAGHTAERVDWQARDNEQIVAANKKILELETAARDKERKYAENMAAISGRYQQELSDAKTKRDRDIAAAYAGTLKLQFSSSSACSAGSQPGSVGTAASGRDAATGAELQATPGRPVSETNLVTLPAHITAGLYALVDDADDVVRQLSACQAVILADRNVVGTTEALK